jgi:hypothetical protein
MFFSQRNMATLPSPNITGVYPQLQLFFLKRAMHKKAARGRLGLESL